MYGTLNNDKQLNCILDLFQTNYLPLVLAIDLFSFQPIALWYKITAKMTPSLVPCSPSSSPMESWQTNIIGANYVSQQSFFSTYLPRCRRSMRQCLLWF